MGFLSQRFPERISQGATGGHAYFDTTLVSSISGHEIARQNWSMARGQWSVAQALDSEEKFVLARDFLYMARGKVHRFRFKDPFDFALARANSRLVQITSTTFQAAKVYGDDPTYEYIRSLTRLVAGTVYVYLNGVLQASPAQCTVDLDTGIVTFASAPGGATREVACEFDVPCRFDIDRQDAVLVHRESGRLIVDWADIAIREAREP